MLIWIIKLKFIIKYVLKTWESERIEFKSNVN